MKKEQLEALRDRLAGEVASLGYELIDLDFTREQGEDHLCFFIDGPNGIGLADCERVSNHLSPLLDVLDPIDQAYYLDVSSPDLSRPLKTDRDLERNVGQMLELTFYQKRDGKKRVSGELLSFTPEALQLEVGTKTVEIPRAAISKIQIAIQF